MHCFRCFLFTLLAVVASLAGAQYTLDWTAPIASPPPGDFQHFRFGADGSIYVSQVTSFDKFRVARFSPTGQLIYNAEHQEVGLPAGWHLVGVSVVGAADGRCFAAITCTQDIFPNQNGLFVWCLTPQGTKSWSHFYSVVSQGNGNIPGDALRIELGINQNLVVMSPGTPHSVFWLSNESGAILSQTFPFLWGGPVALSPTEEALYVFEQVNLERDLTKITPSGIAWRRKAFPSLPNLGVVAGDIRCEEDGSVLMLGIDPSPVPGSTYLINRARTDGTVLGPIAQLPFPFDEPEQTVSLLPRPGGDFVAQLHYEGLKKDVLTTFNSAGGLLNVTEFPFVSPSEGDPVSIGTIIGADSAGRIFLGLDPYLAWGGTWEQDRYFVNVDHSGAKLPCEPWVPYAPNHRITRRVSDDGRLLMRRRTGQNYFIELYSPAGVPHPDSYSLGEGGTLNVAAPGVKGNDGGASGMTVELVTPPTKGSLTLNPSGSFLYTSTGGWGADSFTYRLRNGAYVSRPGTVSINIIAVYPKALTTNKLQLVGGQQATITVKLDRPAALDGAVVNISSTRFTVPATVTVPYGALQVAFLATAIPQPAPAAGAIYAVRAGRMASISITVNPPALAALAVNPTTLKGGGTFLLYAGLNGTAPSSGIRVAITCDKPAIALVPNAIWVLFNASTQSAPVRTTRPTANTVCTITGSYNGVQKVTTVNVTP